MTLPEQLDIDQVLAAQDNLLTALKIAIGFQAAQNNHQATIDYLTQLGVSRDNVDLNLRNKNTRGTANLELATAFLLNDP